MGDDLMSNYKVHRLMKYATSKKKENLENALASDNYCIQLKKDGASYILAKDPDGSVHLYKDSISKKTGKLIDKIENVPHLKDFAEEVFPNGSQILVEICYGQTSKDVNKIMLSLPAKAIARQNESYKARAYIFDILYWGGKPIYKEDFAERWSTMEEIWKSWEKDSLLYDWISIAETHINNKAEKIAEWLAFGEEGGVLKMLHSTNKVDASYHVREIGATEARPMHTTYKIKQVDTVDVIILGVEMPNKAYQGKDPENYQYRDEDGNPVNRLWSLGYANAFTIGAYDSKGELIKIGTVASGLDDEIRAEAAVNPSFYIGKVIEVDCMSKDIEAKTLRHPRLMKFRPDKFSCECTMEEIF